MFDEQPNVASGEEPPEIVNDPEGSWTARCRACEQVFDLDSLGWNRRGAVSWRKRTSVHCPSCDQRRMMAIVHVDRYGRPDQPFSYAFKWALLIQAIVWGVLAGVAAIAVGICWCLGVFN